MDELPEFGCVGSILAAIAGVVTAEVLYFQNADEVRLLFVLLLIPLGAVGGVAIFWLIIGVIALAVYAGMIAIAICAVLGVLAALVLVLKWLYDTIVWTN